MSESEVVMRSSQVWNRVSLFTDRGDVKGMPNHFDQESGEWGKLPKPNKSEGYWRSQKDMYQNWEYRTAYQTSLLKAMSKARGKNRKMLINELKRQGVNV